MPPKTQARAESLQKWLFRVFLLAAVYFSIFGGRYTAWNLWEIGLEQDEEMAALSALRLELVGIRQRIESLQSDPVVLEREARERYGMIRDGELIIRFIEDSELQDGDVRGK